MKTVKTFKISNILTGKLYTAELVRETKCYYIVSAELIRGKVLEYRFHKNTLNIVWQNLSLRVSEITEAESLTNQINNLVNAREIIRNDKNLTKVEKVEGGAALSSKIFNLSYARNLLTGQTIVY